SSLGDERHVSSFLLSTAARDQRKSEGDVGVGAPFADVRLSNCGGQGRSGGIGCDDLVDHPDLDRLLHTPGDTLVLGRELSLHLWAYVVVDLGELAPMK